MKTKQQVTTEITFTDAVSTGTYVSSWANSVELQFTETAQDGTKHRYEINMPVADAQALLKELEGDLRRYKETKAEEAAKILEEAKEAEEAEEGEDSNV